MPNITASLFQSPGGRKFLGFITKFVRFVTQQHLKNHSETVWEPENSNAEPTSCALKGFICDDSASLKKEFDTFLSTSTSVETFVTVLSPIFRNLMAKLKEVKSQNRNILSEINQPKNLKSECQDLRSRIPQVKGNLTKELSEILVNLNKIESIAGQKAVKYILNVNSFGLDQDLGIIFDKLLTSVEDFSHLNQDTPVNCNQIETHLKFVEKHRLKMTDLQAHIENDLLAPMKNANRSLKDTSNLDWKNEFNSQLKDVQVLVPKTPGMKIQTNHILKTSKFILNQSEKVCEITTQPNVIQEEFAKPNLMATTIKSNCDETNISVKQSTPTTGQVLLQSPDQSRISMIGQRFRNDSTPTSRQR